MVKRLFFIFLTLSQFCFSQSNRTFLFGKVTDSIKIVKNAHIINLTTKQGTFTNDDGAFRILAKENDSLQISSIGFVTKIFIPKKYNFGMNHNNIILEEKTYKLDEVEIKKTDLIGSLESDLKKTPKHYSDSIIENLEKSIMNLNSEDIMKMPIGEDERHLTKIDAPDNIPAVPFFGGSIGGTLPDYQLETQRATIKLIKYKEAFPKMLLSEFGEHFFFTELKIPKEKYYHFLEYCNPLGIEQLYKNKKVLKLIAILQEESKSYLKIINKKD